MPQRKQTIERRRRWTEIDPEWACLKSTIDRKPGRANFASSAFGLAPERRKQPIQLDLFEPRDPMATYSVIVTNKTGGCAPSSTSIIDAARRKDSSPRRSRTRSSYIPVRTQHGNQLFSLASLFVYNLNREIQMQCRDRDRRTDPKRRALGSSSAYVPSAVASCCELLGSHSTSERLTLVLNANSDVGQEFRSYLDALAPKAA